MQKKGIVLILATAIISGVSVFINKFGVDVINPYIFTGLKNIIVLILILGWILMARDWQILKKIQKKQWLMLIGIGLLGGSIPFLLFYKGLSMTSAVQASFIHKTLFIWAAIFAIIFLKEKINRYFIISAVCLVIGNLFLLQFVPRQMNQGDFLILLAAVFWAAENVLSKRALANLPVRIVIFGRMLFGSLFIVLFWLLTGQFFLVFTLNLAQAGWLLITAVFLFGYVAAWYSGLKHLPVSQAASILVLGGPITTLLSFKQGINILQGLGFVLIIIGIIALFGFGFLRRFFKKMAYVRA